MLTMNFLSSLFQEYFAPLGLYLTLANTLALFIFCHVLVSFSMQIMFYEYLTKAPSLMSP